MSNSYNEIKVAVESNEHLTRARQEFEKLLFDDKDFNELWGNHKTDFSYNEEDFMEWYEEIWTSDIQ